MNRTIPFALVCSLVLNTHAATIINPGFENSFTDWNDTDPSSISSVSHSGNKSAKITGSSGRVSQTIEVSPNTSYQLSAQVLGKGNIGASVNGATFSSDVNSEDWQRVTVNFNSGQSTTAEIYGSYNNGEGRFDDFSIEILAADPPPASGCSGRQNLTIVNATDDGTNDGHVPAWAIDGNFDPESRWSSKGNGKWIQFDLGSVSTVKELGLAWYKGNQRSAFFSVDISESGNSWTNVLANAQSSGSTSNLEYVDITDSDARYVRVIGHGNSSNEWNSLVEARISGCSESPSEPTPTPAPTPTPSPGGLNPSLPPSGNFDLRAWYISVPTDDDGNGKADSIKETDLSSGYEDPRFFYTADDGGMVFRCPIDGYKTSSGTKFTRVELREMLRAGDTSIDTKGVNKNNWVFGSAPSSDRSAAGGVDGNMKATLKVDHVTTSGSSSQVGRVIIGQIHANSDEPIRLYYRKLPNNSKGAIYFAHEPNGGSDQYYEMIGRRSSSASNPSDGIALGETFSYEIDVTGNTLTVVIRRPGKPDVVEVVNMSNSNYDGGGQYMYFKAGVYNQNDSGSGSDYVQATFYQLEHTHD